MTARDLLAMAVGAVLVACARNPPASSIGAPSRNEGAPPKPAVTFPANDPPPGFERVVARLGPEKDPTFVAVDLEIPVGFRMTKANSFTHVVDFLEGEESMDAVSVSRMPCQPKDSDGDCARRWEEILHFEKRHVVQETDDLVLIERRDTEWLLSQRWVRAPSGAFFVQCSAQALDDETLAKRRAICESMRPEW